MGLVELRVHDDEKAWRSMLMARRQVENTKIVGCSYC